MPVQPYRRGLPQDDPDRLRPPLHGRVQVLQRLPRGPLQAGGARGLHRGHVGAVRHAGRDRDVLHALRS